MKRKRRTFSNQFKAKVALEALQERQTLQEIANKYELHPNQVLTWKKQLKSGLPAAFSNKGSTEERDFKAENSRLYEEIGRLKMDLDWLKKKNDEIK